ncbi:MAG: hypothetical protein E7057_07260 [Lentisphaerae bacterium]|nr:hypothetical protein [Lentisphaerota bacterium]
MGFSVKKFYDPDAEFYPGYFWLLNAPMTEENMFTMLHDMNDHMAKSICMHPFPAGWAVNTAAEPHYMTPEYLELMAKVFAEADRLGMHNYLYDEGGFPSGTALGEVIASDPERFARQFWMPDEKNGGYYLFRESIEKPMPYARGDYPNLMEKGCGERFIELAHEKLKKAVGKFFGKSVLYTFTDEPVLPGGMFSSNCIGWCSDFGEEFFKRKNYRIEPFLADIPYIASSGKEREEVRKHRIDYCDVRSQLFVERFMIPIRDWAKKNKLGSGGHHNGENRPEGNYAYSYGHIMRVLRAMDLPGVDIIWRQIYPEMRQNKKLEVIRDYTYDPVTNAAADMPFTKYASSVARQSGGNRVLAETFAVYGNGLTPQAMKFVIDHQLLRGATNFVFSNIPHEYHGKLLPGCRPVCGKYHPFWDWFDMIHTYIARIASMLVQGTPAVKTLVYFDIPSIWCGGKILEKAVKEHLRSAEKLLANHVDFDFADDDALCGGKIIDGKFKVGKICYDTIVVPRENRMDKNAAKMLDKFRKHGGRVLTTKELAQIAPAMEISSKYASSLRVVKRISGSETLYFITNGTQRDIKARLSVPEAGEIQLFDAWNGRRYRIERKGGTVDWHFPPFGSALFVVNSASKADAEYPVFKPGRRKIELTDNWTLKPVKQYVYDKDEYRVEQLDAEPIPAALGDWRKYLGEWFSGEAVYRCEFDSPSSGNAKLVLGEICYVAEVILNGKVLGRTFSDTAEFFTGKALKKGKNLLEIRVVNTAANAVLKPEVLDYWEKNLPRSSYQVINCAFEKESLESGLLGPAVLYFASNNTKQQTGRK